MCAAYAVGRREHEASREAVQLARRCASAPGRRPRSAWVGADGLLRWRPRPAAAAADDCSATVATSPTSASTFCEPRRSRRSRAAISATRPLVTSTASPISAKDARPPRRSRRRPRCAPRRPRRRSRARSVSVWISAISAAIDARPLLGLVGQLADLVGDDREAAALLAGAGRLDGGVEGQEVGLLGDAADRVDHRADRARALAERRGSWPSPRPTRR